jgi:ribA/ribD-fused uncharacterized protein
MNFMEKVKKDISYIHKIDDEIDQWHKNDHKVSLRVFLGMTDEEYEIFVSGDNHFETYLKKLLSLDKIKSFDGNYRFLSNFYKAPFEWNGKLWKTTEHAYQAMKAVDEFTREYIRNLETAREAKEEGKKIKLRSDWEIVKDKVMEEIVFEKFNQNKDIAIKLIQTNDMIIEEGNTWGDRYWGICPPDSNNGLNKLGIILMNVREKIRKNYVS